MWYTTSPTLSSPIHSNVTAGRRFSKNRHYWIEFLSFVGNNGKDEAKAMLKNQESISKIKEAESRSVCQFLRPSMKPESSQFCSHDYASDHYPEVANPGYSLLSYSSSFNVILTFTFRFPKWSLPFMPSSNILRDVPISSTCLRCLFHLILFGFTDLTIFRKDYTLWKYT